MTKGGVRDWPAKTARFLLSRFRALQVLGSVFQTTPPPPFHKAREVLDPPGGIFGRALGGVSTFANWSSEALRTDGWSRGLLPGLGSRKLKSRGGWSCSPSARRLLGLLSVLFRALTEYGGVVRSPAGSLAAPLGACKRRTFLYFKRSVGQKVVCSSSSVETRSGDLRLRLRVPLHSGRELGGDGFGDGGRMASRVHG